MKKFLTLYICVLLLNVIPMPVAAYVQMPTGDALQPLPKAAHPNISGNVNASVKPARNASAATSSTEAPRDTASGGTSQEKPSRWGWYTALFVFVVACISGVLYFFMRMPE